MSDHPITPGGLTARNIYADELSKNLLPFTSLTPESLDFINRVFDLPHGRNLRLRVGAGIIYRAALETAHGDKIELILHCRDDALIFPLELTLNIGVDLQQAEHEPSCRYRHALWIFGDVECNCPYQDYVNNVIMVNTAAELHEVVGIVQQATGRVPVGELLNLR